MLTDADIDRIITKFSSLPVTIQYDCALRLGKAINGAAWMIYPSHEEWLREASIIGMAENEAELKQMERVYRYSFISGPVPLDEIFLVVQLGEADKLYRSLGPYTLDEDSPEAVEVMEDWELLLTLRALLKLSLYSSPILALLTEHRLGDLETPFTINFEEEEFAAPVDMWNISPHEFKQIRDREFRNELLNEAIQGWQNYLLLLDRFDTYDHILPTLERFIPVWEQKCLDGHSPVFDVWELNQWDWDAEIARFRAAAERLEEEDEE